MAISQDQIFAVADLIEADGKKPTLVAVRQALGGGSFATIGPAMVEWRARSSAKQAPLRETTPQSINDLLSGIGTEIWSAALALANGRLAGEREALEEARVQQEASRTEVAEFAEHLSAELDTVKAERTRQDAELALLRQALKDREAAAAGVEQSLASTSARLDEVTRRADQLNEELERVGSQNAELIGMVSQLTQAARAPAVAA